MLSHSYVSASLFLILVSNVTGSAFLSHVSSSPRPRETEDDGDPQARLWRQESYPPQQLQRRREQPPHCGAAGPGAPRRQPERYRPLWPRHSRWPSSHRHWLSLCLPQSISVLKKGLQNSPLQGQINDNIILAPILPLNSFVHSGTGKQGHWLRSGLFQPHHSVFKNVLWLEVSTPNIVAVLIVWLAPPSFSPSLLPPPATAVNFRAGERASLTVMEMEALYFSAEQPEGQARQAAFPALAPPIPRDLLWEQQPAADLPSALSAVTGPRCHWGLGGTDIILLGQAGTFRLLFLNGIWQGALLVSSTHVPRPTIAPEGSTRGVNTHLLG